MTNVIIAESAWKLINKEISYFADHHEGSKEGVVYPLFSWLRKENCLKAPWEVLELEDLDYFVITHALAVPRHYAQHSSVRAGFSVNTEDEKKELLAFVNSWRDEYKKLYPNLELGYVHSHWFSKGWTWPSHGKNCDYPRIHSLWQDLLRVNLNTSLEIIICRNWGFSHRWKACSFGFDKQQKIVSLGEAKIVSDDDYRIRKTLTTPYDLKSLGIEWEEKALKGISEKVKIRRSFFGTTYMFLKDDGRHLALHFPYYFPKTNKILYQRYNCQRKCWDKAKAYALINPSFDFRFEEILKDF